MNNDFYQSYQDELVSLRRHFHMYPECSMKEYETADFIENYIKNLGLPFKRIGETGLITTVCSKVKDAKTIAVRAELDALPIQEKNTFPHVSKKDGISHACGHDAIMSLGLILVKLCVNTKDELPVNVRFLFQPAEENGEGTRLFLKEGAISDCDYFLMYHLATDRTNGMEMHRGPSSAAIGSIEASFHGMPAHWAGSKVRKDAILAAARFVQAVSDINDSFQSPYPHVVGIGQISGGTAKNIVAPTCQVSGTLRSVSLDDYRTLRDMLFQAVSEIEESTHVSIDLKVDENPVPPIISDPFMVDHFYACGKKIYGPACQISEALYLSGDSAAWYFDHAKGIFIVFTAAYPKDSSKTNHPLHSAYFDFDESVLSDCLMALHSAILTLHE